MEEYATPPLPAVLRPYVATIGGYRMWGFAPGTHLGLPTATLACVFDLGPGLDLSGPGPGGVRRFTSCFSGLGDRPVTIHHDGTQHGIMVYLTPLGLHDLFGVPARELAGQVVSGDDLLGADGRRLEDQMRAAPGWGALAVLTAHLLARVPDRPRENLAAQVWERTTVRAGRASVQDLATESGWSVRHLRDSVHREIGVGPKTIGRLARFESTVSALRTGGSIAAVAADCGYADQAHLTREWRRLVGVTPGQWLARAEFTPAD